MPVPAQTGQIGEKLSRSQAGVVGAHQDDAAEFVQGLAAGIGLAALASHFGFGEELASMMMMGLIAVAAILHYGWHKAGKNDLAPVLPYALTVAGLLGVRLWWALAARLQGKRDGARREGERRPSRGGA